MAGGGGDSGSPSRGGRKRKFNDSLNLVPFIDLFSTIVIFLLSTAVWDQLAGIRANLGASAGGNETIETPQELIKKVESNLKVTVNDNTLQMFIDGKSTVINKGPNGFDFKQLEEFFKTARDKFADKKDVVIVSADNALYEDVVGVMDHALEQKFSDLVVTGSGVGK